MNSTRTGIRHALCGRMPRRVRGRLRENSPATTALAPSVVTSALALSVVVIVGLLLVGGLLWRVQGGSWAIIETPSMGRAAPVGTLILTRPEPIDSIRVGEIVSYHPRNAPQELLTHRVVRRLVDGTLEVRGDINGSVDPFPVREMDLAGSVVSRWVGVGWLVRALPYMTISTIVVLLFTRAYVRPRWRSSVRILAICLTFSLAGLILRPYVHPLLIAVVDDAGLTGRASIVSAGLLPTRVTGAPAHFVDLLSGQTGVVVVNSTAPGAPFWVNGSPHLEGWWLLLVSCVCALPLVWCLSIGLTPEEEPEEELEEEPTTGSREVEA